MLSLSPELPFAGTSGWSGSDTSEKRARQNDGDGTTKARQKQAFEFIAQQRTFGITWKELSERTGLHHGSASGVLSVLHLANKIKRLKESRNNCKVYVLPEFVNDRVVEQYGRNKKKSCPHCGFIS